MSSDVALSVRGLSKTYVIRHQADRPTTLVEAVAGRLKRPYGRAPRERFEALRDVSFDVVRGEVLGIIGRNGAGKSTLLKVLSRITPPTAGEIHVQGVVGSLLEVGTGFHPELTGRENVYLNGTILGMRRREVERRFDEIVDFAGIARFLDTPVKRYSSGMYVRLAFAVAAHLDTEILLVDEVLAVGDAEFQRRCLGKMETLANDGRTVLFVSHSMEVVGRLCGRAILLSDGSIADTGPTRHVVDAYLGDSTIVGPVRTWPSGERGTRSAWLRAIKIEDSSGLSSAQFDIRIGIRIVVEYERKPDEEQPLVSLFIKNGSGAELFASNSFHAQRDPAVAESLRTIAVCEIPGNLLAEGRHSVSVMLNTGLGAIHHSEEDAVTFEVFDPGSGDSVRGTYLGEWRGLVRPMLGWTVSPVAPAGEASNAGAVAQEAPVGPPGDRR